ncbi:hypothetical protein L7F22_041319 [Adiantum nelumboides]|nr:hypothetical protein [Adiantum nelumboides]
MMGGFQEYYPSWDDQQRATKYSTLDTSLFRRLPLFFLLLLFRPFSLFLPCLPVAEAASRYLGAAYLTCMRNATSSRLSTSYSANLDTALKNLTALSSQGTRYATTTAGSGVGNTVYAMFQCRGDQSLDLCWECMQNATVRLPQRECPNSLGARIQLDGCYLRYDNQSFFQLDTAYAIGYCYVPTSDPVVLQVIADLMENVTKLAPQQGGFAAASAIGEYAAAQCLGYLSTSECSACLSAVPYMSVCNSTLGKQVHLTSCYYRFEPYSFFEVPLPSPPPAALPPGSGTEPPQLASTLAPKSSGSKTAIKIAVGVAVGVVVLIASMCGILVWRYKASRVKGEKPVDKAASWPRELLQTKARVFSLQELVTATGNFHPTTKLGEGGFGVVYKGTLLDGEQVAIKKLSFQRQDGKHEFLNEVNVITSVQHKNLIRLLGCCVEDSERFLVYEYLSKKSLNYFLFGNSRPLDWSTRYGIIFGMAKGLAYLHEESHIRIIHRDIKASNILLDDQLNPIIADFGLARLVKENATHINTAVAGTKGYLAPEYAMHGELSEKVDVYSFGLVSLEILTGKQNIHSSLLTWVWQNYQQGKALEMVDEKLGSAFSREQAMRAIHVALLCTQENPKQRPVMSMVILWLSGSSAILEVPIRPTFLDYGDDNHQFTSASSSTSQFTHMDDVNHQFTSPSSTSSQFAHPGGQASRFSGQAQSMSDIIEPR